jgi:hypothetical protein
MPNLGQPFVILEGRLDVKRRPARDPQDPPILEGCADQAWPCCTGIGRINDYLEHYNGKYVRVTIEVEEPNR